MGLADLAAGMTEQQNAADGAEAAEQPTAGDGAEGTGQRAARDGADGTGQRAARDGAVAAERSTAADGEDVPAATRVVISYPADLSTWGRSMIAEKSFRAWLRRTLGVVEAGHAWEEFVGVGCCGSALDVPLVVESLEGGGRVGPDTEIEYVEREACGVRGGWQVQSAAGPNEF